MKQTIKNLTVEIISANKYLQLFDNLDIRKILKNPAAVILKRFNKSGQRGGEIVKNIETDYPSKNLFQLFKKDINPYKPLPLKEEKKSLKAGKVGREKLVLHNLFLVIRIAKKYRNRGVDFLDLIQEGIMGLLEALKKFEPEREAKFSTFAFYCIRQAILNVLLDQFQTIRNPRNATRELNEILKTEKWLYRKLGRWPKNQETAEAMGINPARIEEIKNLRNQSKTISLTAQINKHDQSESRSLLEDFLPDQNNGLLEDFLPGGEGPPIENHIYQKELAIIWPITSQALGCDNNGRIFQIVAERKQGTTLKNILEKRKITCLTDSERLFYVLALRANDVTLEDIGQDFKLSRERVRQLEARALIRLRHPKCKRKLEQFL